jgi:hypothetical protein
MMIYRYRFRHTRLHGTQTLTIGTVGPCKRRSATAWAREGSPHHQSLREDEEISWSWRVPDLLCRVFETPWVGYFMVIPGHGEERRETIRIFHLLTTIRNTRSR